MSIRTIAVAAAAAGLVLGASGALAQHQGMKPGAGMPGQGMEGMQGEHHGKGMSCGMMQGGGMMGGGMRGHATGGRSHLPQLPPGNEKLQLQMQAEMMQKMGEILGKYAARVKE